MRRGRVSPVPGLLAGAVLCAAAGGCASGPSVVRGTWAVAPALDGSGAGWEKSRPVAAGRVDLRMVNCGTTLFFEFRARDDATTRWMMGEESRYVIVWLDAGRQRSKELGVQFVPEEGASTGGAVRPVNAELLTSTAGLFAILPAGDQGIKAARGTADGRAVIEVAVPVRVLHRQRPDDLDVGLEGSAGRSTGPARPVPGVPESEGPPIVPPEGDDALTGLGGVFPVGPEPSGFGRRRRRASATPGIPEVDQWWSASPAAGPAEGGE